MPIRELTPADDARHVLDKGRALIREGWRAGPMRVAHREPLRSAAEILDSAFDYDLDAPRLTLIDVVGTAEIDGREGVCHTEMAWPPDYLAANLKERA